MMRTPSPLSSNDLKSREDFKGTVVWSPYSSEEVKVTGPLHDGYVCIGEVSVLKWSVSMLLSLYTCFPASSSSKTDSS